MTDIISCGDQCVEVKQSKNDDFIVTFEILHEELTPFDPSELVLVWTISANNEVIITISGEDIEIDDNYTQFVKASSYFSTLSFMGSYWHRLFDQNTNTTLLEGKFILK